MARSRGYHQPYGNEALRQLREWEGLTPSDLAKAVCANGGSLTTQHLRNIETRGVSRIFPSEELVDQILTALHSDRQTLERTRAEIAAQAVAREQRAELDVLLSASTFPTGDEDMPASAQFFSAAVGADPQVYSLASRPTWSNPLLGASKMLRASRRSALAAPSYRQAHTAAAELTTTPAPQPPIRVQVPTAPTTPDAVHELRDLYDHMNDVGRRQLLGRARQLLRDYPVDSS